MTSRILVFPLAAVAVGAALYAGYLHTRISALDQSLRAQSPGTSVDVQASDVMMLRSLVVQELEGVRGELAALRQRVAAVKERDPMTLASEKPPAPAPPGDMPLPGDTFSVDVDFPSQAMHPVTGAYARDAGQNDWSVRTVAQIETAASTDVFFTEAGGEVSSSCGGATCRVEWNFPLSAEESPDERTRLMARARYHLLTLTAQNAAQVGPMTSEWVQDGDADVLMVTFVRDATLANP